MDPGLILPQVTLCDPSTVGLEQ